MYIQCNVNVYSFSCIFFLVLFLFNAYIFSSLVKTHYYIYTHAPNVEELLYSILFDSMIYYYVYQGMVRTA